MTKSPKDLSFGGIEYRRIVTKSGGLFYTTYINRNLAWICSRNLQRLTPNQISIGAFFLLFAALPLAYFSASAMTSIAAYLLLAINYVLDSSDGQVSRLRGMGSPLGEWVDHTLDGVRILLIHSTLMFVLIKNNLPDYYILLGFLNIVFSASLYFATELAGKILSKQVQNSVRTGQSAKRLLKGIVLLPTDHGIFILIFLIIHKPTLLAVVYSAYGIYWAGIFMTYFLMTFLMNSKSDP